MPYVAVAVCPHPPLLIPVVAAGAAAELDPLRGACDRAVAVLLDAERVEIVGSAPEGRDYAGGSLRGYGVDISVDADGSAGGDAPLSLVVGRWLLARAGCGLPVTAQGVPRRPQDEPADDVALLVMADGSARRTPGAPGALHPDAAGFDAGLAAWLAGTGELDLTRSEEMWCGGAAALGELHRRTSGTAWSRDLRYDDAPYGVAYFVASWRRG